MQGGYTGVVASQQAAGTNFTTFTTAKSVINPQALWTVPAGFFAVPGQTVSVDVWGSVGTLVTTPGTIVFQVMMGPTANIIAFTTGTIQLNATAHTTIPFHLRIRLTVDTVGSGTTSKFRGQGDLGGVMFTLTAAQTDATNTSGLYSAPATAPALGTGWDSTIANIFDFWAGFSISNAANTIQIQQYVVTSDN